VEGRGGGGLLIDRTWSSVPVFSSYGSRKRDSCPFRTPSSSALAESWCRQWVSVGWYGEWVSVG
jgi:hypothetical protein